jgi:hypothetical protein
MKCRLANNNYQVLKQSMKCRLAKVLTFTIRTLYFLKLIQNLMCTVQFISLDILIAKHCRNKSIAPIKQNCATNK